MFGAPLLSLDDLMGVYADHAGLEFDFVQLAPGNLEYGQASVMIGDVTISSERLGKPLRVRLRTPPGVVSVSFMLAAGGPAFWRGHEIEKSHALVFGEVENDYILPAGLCAVNFAAPTSAFEALGLPRLRAGLWRSAPEPRGFLISVARAALAGRPFAPGDDIPILGAICDALAGDQSALQIAAAGPGDPTRQFQILQRAEQLELETLASLDAIADSLGTSQRSLQRAIKGLAGLGPQSYLRIMRLHRFRQSLLQRGIDDTITGLAYDHGFENMGRMSSQYRDWFGELPRETRRRQVR